SHTGRAPWARPVLSGQHDSRCDDTRTSCGGKARGNDDAKKEERADDLSELRVRTDRNGAVCQGAPEHDAGRAPARAAGDAAATQPARALTVTAAQTRRSFRTLP